MAGKPIRLGKAAGELNVGIPTIVEFLGSKGIVIDASPTARLEQEHFDILCQEFAADQNMKEQSKAALRREKRESLSIKDKPQEETVAQPVQEDEDEGEINLEEIKRQVLNETPAAPAPVVEKSVAEPQASTTEPQATENKVNVVPWARCTPTLVPCSKMSKFQLIVPTYFLHFHLLNQECTEAIQVDPCLLLELPFRTSVKRLLVDRFHRPAWYRDLCFGIDAL